uniref:Lipase maturation factor 1 n=1 Tax=Mola mola TaxID=94237 RepID=A0A3Q4BGV8_MOLML
MASANSDSSGGSVRRRRVDGGKTESTSADSAEEHGANSSRDTESEEKTAESLHTGTYWLTRIVLLRAVTFIYFVAFSIAYNQNKQLIGENGLMPCKKYLNSVKRYVGGKIGLAAFTYTPSILWLLDWSDMDANLDGIALVGMALSAFVLVTGMGNMVIMVTLWVLYHSLVNVGQLWYSFGK